MEGPAEPAAPETAAEPVPALALPGPAGVGGWLWLPLVSLTILQPACGWIMPAQYVELAGARRYWWIAIVWSLLVASGVYVGVSLWSRRARAPRLAILYYVACAPALTWIAWQTAHADRYATASTIGGGCVGALVWGFYFHLSERVRNTYGPLPATAFSPLRTALVACAAGALTIAGAAVVLTTSRPPWTEYALDGAGRFSVRGPGAPRRSGDELLFNDTVRAFRAAVYTSDRDRPPATFAGEVNDVLIATLKARVHARQEHSRLGQPASTFAADLPGETAGTTDLFATAVAIDARTVVSLVIAGPPGGRTSEEADRFWNTLRITSPPIGDVAHLHASLNAR